jgi:hypothetical protein
VTWNTTADEFLIVFAGDDDTPPQVDDEVEVFGRRFAPYHAPAEPPPPPPDPTPPPPPPVVCPAVIVPAPDRDKDGCPDATAITKRFQVAFTFKRRRIAKLVVRGLPRNARVTVVCKRGCSGPKGRTVGRGRTKARGKAKPVKLSLSRLRLARRARIEVRVGQARRVRRFSEFEVRARVPAVKRVATGCMWPTIAKRVAC